MEIGRYYKSVGFLPPPPTPPIAACETFTTHPWGGVANESVRTVFDPVPPSSALI